MLPNTNPQTGIRYGMISQNSLADWVMDEIFQNGTNLSYESAWEDYKDEHELTEDSEDIDEHQEEFSDGYYEDDDTYSATIDGISVQTSSLGLWVFQSPTIVKARLCSPCVPNCGDLNTIDANGHECYGLPVEWLYTAE
jgi:hypothetical protein